MNPEITVDREVPGCAVITLAAVDRRNALTGEMARQLVRELEAIAADESIGVMVLFGEGGHFCAGAHRGVLRGAAAGDGRALVDLHAIYETFDVLRAMPIPTIAAVCGSAVGAGLNLALACTVRVVATDSYLRSMFIANEIHPGGGHIKMLQQSAGDQTSTLLAALDIPINGDAAARMGLAAMSVLTEDVLETALQLTKHAAAHPKLSRKIRSSIERERDMTMLQACEYEAASQADSLATSSVLNSESDR